MLILIKYLHIQQEILYYKEKSFQNKLNISYEGKLDSFLFDILS